MSRRLTAFALLFALALAAFAGRLWDLQGVHGAEYAQTARRSIAWTETVPAARGRLLDRKGRVLAEDRAVWTLRVSPRAGEETVARLQALCPDWDGEGDVASVSPALLAEIRGEGLEGVTFLPAPQRRDSGALAPHLLGRVGKMSPAEWVVYREKGYALDALVGKDGAEAAFEDLGFLTPEVKKLLNDSGCPGMRVMQFGFEPLGDSRELPHNYVKNCVAYLGTHDNDTIMGWFKACDPKYAAFAVDYLGLNQQEGFPFGFIRGLMTSVADLVVIQLQDVLGLGSEHRMNLPATTGWWGWRAIATDFDPATADRLAYYTRMTGRAPVPKKK